MPEDAPSDQAPSRKHPAHLPAFEHHNRSVIQFVTVCTQDRRPLLANPAAHALLIAAWKSATWYHVGRYVIMPDHVHLFCAPPPFRPNRSPAGSISGNRTPPVTGRILPPASSGNAIRGIPSFARPTTTAPSGPTSPKTPCAPAWSHVPKTGPIKANSTS